MLSALHCCVDTVPGHTHTRVASPVAVSPACLLQAKSEFLQLRNRSKVPAEGLLSDLPVPVVTVCVHTTFAWRVVEGSAAGRGGGGGESFQL